MVKNSTTNWFGSGDQLFILIGHYGNMAYMNRFILESENMTLAWFLPFLREELGEMLI